MAVAGAVPEGSPRRRETLCWNLELDFSPTICRLVPGATMLTPRQSDSQQEQSKLPLLNYYFGSDDLIHVCELVSVYPSIKWSRRRQSNNQYQVSWSQELFVGTSTFHKSTYLRIYVNFCKRVLIQKQGESWSPPLIHCSCTFFTQILTIHWTIWSEFVTRGSKCQRRTQDLVPSSTTRLQTPVIA